MHFLKTDMMQTEVLKKGSKNITGCVIIQKQTSCFIRFLLEKKKIKLFTKYFFTVNYSLFSDLSEIN